jgi:membrane protease YdiL (CAAX protease family)
VRESDARTADRPRWTFAPSDAAVGVGASVIGLALLLGRPALASNPATAWRPLMVLYAAVIALSLSVPQRRDSRRAHPALVAVVGSVAVAAAWRWVAPGGRLPDNPGFVSLIVVAAVAEEAYFRRVLQGALRPLGPAAAVVITAVLFAAIHVPLYGVAALPVDVGAGLLLGWQRWASGGWVAPGVTHVVANLIMVLP